MNRMKIAVILSLVVALTWPIASFAQVANNRFQAEFQRTDEVISRARTVIAEITTGRNSDLLGPALLKAEALLKTAVELQEQAANLGRGGKYLEGVKTTLLAREKAWQAVSLARRAGDRIVRQTEENETIVLRQLEKTDDLMGQLQDRFPTNPSQMLTSLYNSARDTQRRAWEFYHSRQYRPALRLSRQAERGLLKLNNRLQASGDEIRRLENGLKQIDKRMEQARILISNCDKKEATNLFDRASKLAAECRRVVADGQLKKAEKSLRLLNQQLRKISELCYDGKSLGRTISRLRGEIDNLMVSIDRSGNKEASELLFKAGRHLNQAEKFCDDGDTESCAANIKAADMNIQQAKKLTGI